MVGQWRVKVDFQDPKVYVSTILEVHKKYNALVLISFNNDSGFVAALDKACGRFINANAVTRLANSSSKSPELLAKYCDLLLKKSSKNPEEAELEDTLNQVVSSRRFTLIYEPSSPAVLDCPSEFSWCIAIPVRV